LNNEAERKVGNLKMLFLLLPLFRLSQSPIREGRRKVFSLASDQSIIGSQQSPNFQHLSLKPTAKIHEDDEEEG